LSTVFIYFILPFMTLFLQARMGSAQDVIVVKTQSVPDGEQILDGFKSVCDNSISIKEYNMRGRLDEGERIIKEIKENIKLNPPKVILTIGAPATRLAQEAIKEIHIFFSMVANPYKKGFSGNNISGITSDVPVKLQLEKLQTIVPAVESVGVIYNPRNSNNIIEEAEQVASDMGLKLVMYKVSSQKEVPHAIRNIIEEVSALLIITDSTVVNKNSFKYIITTTLENRIPTMTYTDYLVKAGFLFSLTPDYFSIGKQAGHIVCKPGEDISKMQPIIESPEVLNLAINLKTAKRIGLNISPNILNSAIIYK
jgi:putative tryptophan/tyrosine transport system substrate-binding protein